MVPTSNTKQKKPDPILDRKINVLNECNFCGNIPGIPGIFLLADVRGFKVCNECRDKGLLISEAKMTKKEKKLAKKMRLDMAGMKLPHVTLDRKGNVVA